MKSKLLVLILGAALVGSSTAAVAGPGKDRGDDRPRLEQGHDGRFDKVDWRTDRLYRRYDRHDRGDRHGAYRGKGRGHDRHWGKGRGHDRHWGKKHRHGRHWSKHHRYGGHYGHRAPYTRHYGHGRHVPHGGHRDSLSIILHGHF